MKIIRIFGKNLFAIKYPEEEIDEFRSLFEIWNDIEHLEDFFESNKEDLQTEFWGEISVESAIQNTINYAIELEKTLLKLAERTTENQLSGLEELFKPLNDNVPQAEIWNKSKARKNWLRLYALKAEQDVYIVTGGAIKLTRTMGERGPHQKGTEET